MNQSTGIIVMMIFVASILGPLFWSVNSARMTPSPDQDGWVTLRGTISQWMFGAFMILMGLSGVVYGIHGILNGEWKQGWSVQAIMLIAVLMGFELVRSFFRHYLCRIRYNSEKVEYFSVLKNISTNWSEVEEIKVGSYGPMIVTAEGNIIISTLMWGFYGLLEMAKEKGVKMQDSPFLKTNTRSAA